MSPRKNKKGNNRFDKFDLWNITDFWRVWKNLA